LEGWQVVRSYKIYMKEIQMKAVRNSMLMKSKYSTIELLLPPEHKRPGRPLIRLKAG